MTGTTRSATTVVAAGLLAAVLAGCGGGSGSAAQTTGTVLPPVSPSSAAPSSAPSRTTTTTPAAPTTTQAPAPATTPAGGGGTGGGPAGCPAASLALSLGQGSSGAGTQGIPLVFTNTGSAPCTMTGFPGVSLVAGDAGTQVGAAADRTGPEGSAVVLDPGGVASALVLVTAALNYPEQQCQPTDARGFRVYPPNDTAALFVPQAETGCGNPAVSVLRVQAVTGGATGGI